MNGKRNGASAISFDKVIFVFGGNNQDFGSTDTIERYNMEFDKWIIINLKLNSPVHDSIALPVGGFKVLIFGGSLPDSQPNNFWQIYDMTSELINLDSE